MEIYLRVEDGCRRHVADVEARIEPSHTVDDLALAIVDAVDPSRATETQATDPSREKGVHTGEPPRLSTAKHGSLPGHSAVVDAGIVSGTTVVLGPSRPEMGRRSGQLTLTVASGPDAGRTVDLPAGDWTIGRADDCHLVLTDPQVSRRHLRLSVDPGSAGGPPAGRDGIGVTGQPAKLSMEVLVGDRNEVRTGGRTVEGCTDLAIDQAVRVGASTLVVRPRPTAQRSRIDDFAQVPFHRTPYFPAPVQARKVDALADIPTKPEPARFGYLSALLPVLMGVSFAVLFDSPRYLLFAAFSPLMMLGSYVEQRRRSGHDFRRSVERFDSGLEAKVVEVHQALADERERRFAEAPDVATLRDRAVNHTLDLWVRDREAYDFLTLRAGVGDVSTVLDVALTESGDQHYRDRVVEAYGDTTTLTDVPIALELGDLGVVGLVGRSVDTTELAASLVVQAAALHSPEDLVITAAVSPGRDMADWLKWLPHCRSSSSPLAVGHLASTRAEADELVSALLAEAERRIGFTAGVPRFPRLLIVLDRKLEPDSATVSRLLDVAADVGFATLWLSDSKQRVPRQARAVVDCAAVTAGALSTISFTDPDRADHCLDIDRAGPGIGAETARALAPLRDASSINAATAIPRVVPLFTALGIEAVDADWVAGRWQTDRGYSLQAPIGYTDAGPLMLDIVEHGPHGLIGGTSGAGKSELVMSIVAGLVAFNPPNRINFLFIDYKGGASSDLFTDVPHTVGYVTNLDGLLARRALTSLRAELNRRMNLLQGKAKDLEEMLARYPDEAPASLVIVVDEFATLVQEIPDFVAGIVDIAQRGRSLGIHLLLATQRPSGSVNDNIKANTNLRIALRMLDGAESTSVIGSADAASIPTPLKGRGLARMGSGELVSFQSAWAGAPLLAEQGPPPIEIRPFGPAPAPPPSPSVARSPGDRIEPVATRTQIDALLDAVVDAGRRLGHEPGRAPWLQPLASELPLRDVRAASAQSSVGERPGARVSFGMVDDPANQAQYPAVCDLATSGGLLVCGTGGSGKSTVLRTAAVSAALDDAEHGGGHLTIFALDFASRQLGNLRRLPQCAAVAGSDDMEAVTRVIAVLHREFERRRQAGAEAVARSEPPPDDPSVLILIDGLDALITVMDQGGGGLGGGLGQYHADLIQVLTDGRQVGMYPIATTSRMGAVRANLTSAISDRLVLRQADAQSYTDAGIGGAEAKELNLAPGQGFFNGPNLVQVACLAVEACDGGEQQALDQLADGLIGRVNPRLKTEPLPRALGLPATSDPLKPVIGLADMTCSPFELDLAHNNVSVIGDPRSGRSTALATIGAQAAAAGAEVWVLARPGSVLSQLDGAYRRCFDEGDSRIEFLDELSWQATSGSATSNSDRPGSGMPGSGCAGRHRLLLIDDIDLLPEHDRPLLVALEPVLGAVRFVAAGSKPRGFTSHPIVQQVRACRSTIYLRPHDPREAHEVLGTPVPWHPGLPMVEGRGLVVVDRLPTIVQLASPFLDR